MRILLLTIQNYALYLFGRLKNFDIRILLLIYYGDIYRRKKEDK